MSDQEFDESVVNADRWSKVIALFVAIGVYLLSISLIADRQFSGIIAAFVAIGVRLYIPYHASMLVPKSERVSLSSHSATGNYHHGAAGAGLVFGSLCALGVWTVRPEFFPAVGTGVIVLIATYLVLTTVLPGE